MIVPRPTCASHFTRGATIETIKCIKSELKKSFAILFFKPFTCTSYLSSLSCQLYKMAIPRPAKDWDKICRDFEEEEKKEGNTGGEADFFRQLYESADDDAKRAMIKSMQQSHGTKLNMSWDEVKDGDVKPYDSDDESTHDTKKMNNKKGKTFTKEELDRLKGLYDGKEEEDD